jgi:hypothetical protein
VGQEALCPADPNDVRLAISFALRYQGLKRIGAGN